MPEEPTEARDQGPGPWFVSVDHLRRRVHENGQDPQPNLPALFLFTRMNSQTPRRLQLTISELNFLNAFRKAMRVGSIDLGLLSHYVRRRLFPRSLA